MLQLNHIHLKSTDPRKAAAWYVEMLGAKVIREAEIRGAFSVLLDISGLRVNIGAPLAGQSLPRGSADQHLGLEHFGLQSDDVEGLLARLKAKGVEVLEPMATVGSGTKIVFVRAPDDVRIELMQIAPS